MHYSFLFLATDSTLHIPLNLQQLLYYTCHICNSYYSTHMLAATDLILHPLFYEVKKRTAVVVWSVAGLLWWWDLLALLLLFLLLLFSFGCVCAVFGSFWAVLGVFWCLVGKLSTLCPFVRFACVFRLCVACVLSWCDAE